MSAVRDHGGDLDRAIAEFGGARHDWLDLSTGINRRPWPAPPIARAMLGALPHARDIEALAGAAKAAYGASEIAACLPLAGAQAAIQLVPRIRASGHVRILGPTYNEHAAAFRIAGWHVEQVTELSALHGADAAVVVNPNNPTGRAIPPRELHALADRIPLVIIDESFGDVAPSLSLCPDLGRPGLIVLRSFGKFYGLAGLRLGFALGARADLDALAALAGPWQVSGPALAIGTRALADRDWAVAMRAQLASDARRLDALAAGAGWKLEGGTNLFRLYDVGDGRVGQAAFAGVHIWTRRFPRRARWLRLGLPGPEAEWERVACALG